MTLKATFCTNNQDLELINNIMNTKLDCFCVAYFVLYNCSSLYTRQDACMTVSNLVQVQLPSVVVLSDVISTVSLDF